MRLRTSPACPTPALLSMHSNVMEKPLNAPQLDPIAHHSVAVIGGGQAGLSISWHLAQSGIDHVVFEKERAGHAWRAQRWDTFCLVTPNWQCQLPGFPYAGSEPNGFMVKNQIVEYIEAYARSFSPPVMEDTIVKRLARNAAGRFEVSTTYRDFTADQVVVA